MSQHDFPNPKITFFQAVCQSQQIPAAATLQLLNMISPTQKSFFPGQCAKQQKTQQKKIPAKPSNRHSNLTTVIFPTQRQKIKTWLIGFIWQIGPASAQARVLHWWLLQKTQIDSTLNRLAKTIQPLSGPERKTIMFGAKDVGPVWNDKEEKKTIRSQGMIKKKPCFHTTPGEIWRTNWEPNPICPFTHTLFTLSWFDVHFSFTPLILWMTQDRHLCNKFAIMSRSHTTAQTLRHRREKRSLTKWDRHDGRSA